MMAASEENSLQEHDHSIKQDPMNEGKKRKSTERAQEQSNEDSTAHKCVKEQDECVQLKEKSHEVSIENEQSAVAAKEVQTGPAPSTPKTGGIFGMAAKSLVTFGTVQKDPKMEKGREQNDLSKEIAPVPFVLESIVKATPTVANPPPPSAIPASGEEGEYTLASAKAKLFVLTPDNRDWAERGMGQVKLNVLTDDPKQSRLLMRAEGVQKVILNVRLFPEMATEIVQTRHIRFSAMNGGDGASNFQHYLLRFRNAEDAIQFQIRLEHQIGRLSDVKNAEEFNDDSSYPSSFDAYQQQQQEKQGEEYEQESQEEDYEDSSSDEAED